MDDVAVAYLHPGKVAGGFCRSLVNVTLTYPGLIRAHLEVVSGANVSWARNQVVESFLTSDCDWLWMVDSDMVFDPHAPAQLLHAADPEERPIVGALCFAAYRQDGGYRLAPTIYDFRDDGLARFDGYPENTVLRVGATGAACLLVHRKVFEAFPEQPMRWFFEEIIGGRLRSEDVTFCHRAGEQGFPIFVHTGVKTGHAKQVVLDEAMYHAQKEAVNGDH